MMLIEFTHIQYGYLRNTGNEVRINFNLDDDYCELMVELLMTYLMINACEVGCT